MSYAKKILGIAIMLCLMGCEEVLLHQIDELTANQVKLYLAERGIQAKKVAEGGSWNIAVSSAEVTPALRAIDGSRLLRRDLRRETLADDSFLKSKEERTFQLELREAFELEQTLERIPAVLEARIHVKRQEGEYFLAERKEKSTASVLLIVEEEARVDSELVKSLVSGATGVLPDQVGVVVEGIMATDADPTPENVLPAVATTEEAASSEVLSGVQVRILPHALLIAALLFSLMIVRHRRLRGERADREKLNPQSSLQSITKLDKAATGVGEGEGRYQGTVAKAA